MIKAVGGIELFLGGIGEDGHIAFNEPGAFFSSTTKNELTPPQNTFQALPFVLVHVLKPLRTILSLPTPDFLITTSTLYVNPQIGSSAPLMHTRTGSSYGPDRGRWYCVGCS